MPYVITSVIITPNDHTSALLENNLIDKTSGLAHRTGYFDVSLAVYSSSRAKPKSATLEQKAILDKNMIIASIANVV